jgi:prolyl-tRNA editing enzyme YbaK/EbsC (Cys-tRNA(Pro) deacylase)
MAGEQPILVINNGMARVDRKKLAAFLGMNRKRVKFARAEQALAVTGYRVGSMPPFGHREDLRTLVDADTAELDTLYGGGGDIDAMMQLSSSELLKVTHAEVADISE